MMKMNVDRDKFDREREKKKKLHQLLYMRSNWGLFVIWQNLCIIGGKMRVSVRNRGGSVESGVSWEEQKKR